MSSTVSSPRIAVGKICPGELYFTSGGSWCDIVKNEHFVMDCYSTTWIKLRSVNREHVFIDIDVNAGCVVEITASYAGNTITPPVELRYVGVKAHRPSTSIANDKTSKKRVQFADGEDGEEDKDEKEDEDKKEDDKDTDEDDIEITESKPKEKKGPCIKVGEKMPSDLRFLQDNYWIEDGTGCLFKCEFINVSCCVLLKPKGHKQPDPWKGWNDIRVVSFDKDKKVTAIGKGFYGRSPYFDSYCVLRPREELEFQKKENDEREKGEEAEKKRKTENVEETSDKTEDARNFWMGKLDDYLLLDSNERVESINKLIAQNREKNKQKETDDLFQRALELYKKLVKMVFDGDDNPQVECSDGDKVISELVKRKVVPSGTLTRDSTYRFLKFNV